MSKRCNPNNMKKDISQVRFPVNARGQVCFGGKAADVDITSGQSLTRPVRRR